jgi:hypothetical protein
VRGCGWALAIFFVITSSTPSDAKTSKLQKSLFGCWEYKNPDPKYMNSHLVCFSLKGRVAGVTFDAGDGWDWQNNYSLKKDEISFDGKFWGRIQQIDGQKMEIESNWKILTYKFICRTKKQNIQCERL